eukprot:gene12-12822_t
MSQFLSQHRPGLFSARTTTNARVPTPSACFPPSLVKSTNPTQVKAFSTLHKAKRCDLLASTRTRAAQAEALTTKSSDPSSTPTLTSINQVLREGDYESPLVKAQIIKTDTEQPTIASALDAANPTDFKSGKQNKE